MMSANLWPIDTLIFTPQEEEEGDALLLDRKLTVFHWLLVAMVFYRMILSPLALVVAAASPLDVPSSPCNDEPANMKNWPQTLSL